MNMKSNYLVLGVFVGFLMIVGIDFGSRYFGKDRPFSKGLYRQSLAGRVVSSSNNRGRVTLKLTSGSSSYFFNPGRDPIRTGLTFFSTVQKGDSLWKLPMSDTIHTVGKNGIEYRWPFSTIDQFSRSYLEEERDKSKSE